ncbi:hypothetical protein [Microvirga solisilvae]|nr:hypothetical protein [Microvirga solisilvae]
MPEILQMTTDQVEQAVGYIFIASFLLLALAGLADRLWPVKTSNNRKH